MENKEIIHQIANTLCINVQNVTKYGLLQGRFGIAVFFYHYARYTGDKRYNNFPDELISYLLKKIGKDYPKNLDDGLIGIGWGLDYVVKEGFVEADDNFFNEGDAEICKMDMSDFFKEMELPIPLFSKGLYALQRKKTDMLKKSISEVNLFIEKLSSSKIPLLYLNSIIYVLLAYINMGEKTDEYKIILDNLYTNALRASHKKISYLNFLLLQKNISMMQDNYAKKWTELLSDSLIENSEPNSLYDKQFVNFLFDRGMNFPVDINEIYSLMRDLQNQQLNYNNLSIYKGLAGIGLAIMRNYPTL